MLFFFIVLIIIAKTNKFEAFEFEGNIFDLDFLGPGIAASKAKVD